MVIDSGPSVNIASNQWTTVTISLGYDAVKVSVGSNSVSGLLATPAKPGVLSDLFISNPFIPAVIGNIRRIKITGKEEDGMHLCMYVCTYDNINSVGPLCCAQTSYYQSDWQSCGNAADYTTANPVQSCGTCLSYSCMDWVVGSQGRVSWTESTTSACFYYLKQRKYAYHSHHHHFNSYHYYYHHNKYY